MYDNGGMHFLEMVFSDLLVFDSKTIIFFVNAIAFAYEYNLLSFTPNSSRWENA